MLAGLWLTFFMRPFFFFISPLAWRLGQTGFLFSSLCGRAGLPTCPFILVRVLSLCGVLCLAFSILAKAQGLLLTYQLGETSMPSALDSCCWHCPQNISSFLCSLSYSTFSLLLLLLSSLFLAFWDFFQTFFLD